MATHFVLHGGCHCGRNYYVVQPPPGAPEIARVLFDSLGQTHYTSASPVSAYLRIPLSWYHSGTTAYFDDETPAMIHRVYELSNSRDNAFVTQRRFCGFCGTPLSFWSESPQQEADFIRLAVGSLHAQDLNRLDDWGAMGEENEESTNSEDEEGHGKGLGEAKSEKKGNQNKQDSRENRDNRDSRESRDGSLSSSVTSSSSTGLPWLDRFLAGSLLDRQLLHQRRRESTFANRHRLAHRTAGSSGLSGLSGLSGPSGAAGSRLSAPTDAHVHRHDKASATSADGSVHVEWEIMEWTEGDDDGKRSNSSSSSDRDSGPTRDHQSPAKRQKHADDTAMDVESS